MYQDSVMQFVHIHMLINFQIFCIIESIYFPVTLGEYDYYIKIQIFNAT